jgi:hypothetical protein
LEKRLVSVEKQFKREREEDRILKQWLIAGKKKEETEKVEEGDHQGHGGSMER